MTFCTKTVVVVVKSFLGRTNICLMFHFPWVDFGNLSCLQIPEGVPFSHGLYVVEKTHGFSFSPTTANPKIVKKTSFFDYFRVRSSGRKREL